MSKHCLSLDLLPEIYKRREIKGLPEKYKKLSTIIPQTYSRADSAVNLLQHIDLDVLAVTERHKNLREGYFRSALAEIVSMESAFERDCEQISNYKISHKLYDSNNPLLHLTRLLRNYEVHLSKTNLVESVVSIHGIDKFGNRSTEDFDISVYYISNLNYEEVLKLDNASKYLKEDLKKLVDWFNLEQQELGVYPIFDLAIQNYLDELDVELTNSVCNNACLRMRTAHRKT